MRRSYRNFLDHGSAVPVNSTKTQDVITGAIPKTAWVNHVSHGSNYGIADELTTSSQNYSQMTTYSNPVVARPGTTVSSSSISGYTYSQAFPPSTTTTSFPIGMPTLQATSIKTDHVNPEMPTNSIVTGKFDITMYHKCIQDVINHKLCTIISNNRRRGTIFATSNP